MDYLDILNQIEEVTIDDIENPKLELDDMVNIHSSLTLDNPLTYKAFLANREDLNDEEKDVILEIIKRLEHNKKVLYEYTMKDMNDFELVEEVQNNVVYK